MKKNKIVKEFIFKNKNHQEVVDLINKKIPISLKGNEDLIDRIHNKYPLISKSQTTIIVKYIFQSIRDLLVLGKVLNFNSLFVDTKLLFFPYKNGVDIVPAIKIKISTPSPMRFL